MGLGKWTRPHFLPGRSGMKGVLWKGQTLLEEGGGRSKGQRSWREMVMSSLVLPAAIIRPFCLGFAFPGFLIRSSQLLESREVLITTIHRISPFLIWYADHHTHPIWFHTNLRMRYKTLGGSDAWIENLFGLIYMLTGSTIMIPLYFGVSPQSSHTLES